MKIINWVSASAGTGKTTHIVKSISNIINDVPNPKSILCISFTNAAINEMRHKLHTITKTEPLFCTIHALGKEMFADSKYTVADQNLLEHIIAQAFDSVLTKPEWFDLVRAISYDHASLIHEIQSIILSDNVHNIKHGLMDFKYELDPITIRISNTLANEMRANGHEQLLNDLLSHDMKIYEKLVNKNFKLKPHLTGDKFLKAFSGIAAQELESVLHNVVNFIKRDINKAFIDKTIVFNEFIMHVYDEYNRIKKLFGVYDFNDLINSSDVNSALISTIKHIFIDEAQDTNPMQQKFLLNIIQEISQHDDCSVTVVGDSKQTIYNYMGSSLNAYKNFKNTLQQFAKSANIIFSETALSKSYRMPTKIINFVRNVMECNSYVISARDEGNNKNGYVKIWMPISRQVDYPQYHWDFVHKIETPKWMQIFVDECKKIIANGGKYSDICLLFQKRCSWMHHLIYVLEKNDIPIAEYPLCVNTNNIIYELMMFASLAIDQENDGAIAAILKGPFFNISDQELLELCYERADSVINVMSVSEIDKIQKAYKMIIDIISCDQDAMLFFGNILFHTEYGAFLRKHFCNEVNIFWEHVIAFGKIGSSIAKFIEYISSTQNSYIMPIDGIKISTIHNFKGREGMYVFLSNLHVLPIKNIAPVILWKNLVLYRSKYPLYDEMKMKYLNNESKSVNNLLYVAMTRAKNGLYILPPPESTKIFHHSLYSRIVDNINQCSSFNYEIVKIEN